MMPPMRPRAGTTLMLSTVANTAFSSATVREATVRISAPAGAAPNAATATRLNRINLRMCLPVTVNAARGAAVMSR
ncbi:hypothetical protein GALL_481890 [mine drainage metagenome]|uniref:Uncharacterized protein n=1 Tax=mine drainage metagenome TaxID=410659 RepID=A0A1J5PFN8_9ZZZZ